MDFSHEMEVMEWLEDFAPGMKPHEAAYVLLKAQHNKSLCGSLFDYFSLREEIEDHLEELEEQEDGE